MSRTPPSPPLTRALTATRPIPDIEHRVRPLPPTEPGIGERPHTPVSPGHTPPRPPREDAIPVPARRATHALVAMALEVVDRQRPPHQTGAAFPAHIVEMLRTLARVGVPGQALGPARIHRVHISPAGPSTGTPHDADAVDYEVCATYARGPRLFAVAARIRVTARAATCTALRLA